MAHDVYREHVLDHGRHPRNFGKPAKADASAHDANMSCGDEITLYAVFSKKGKEKIIKDAAFEGRGCMICIAAASMLTEQVTGKKISVASRLKEKDILAFFGGELTASRANCALISYNALGKLLSQR